MSKPTTGLRRAGIASFATGALALSACVVGAGAASADADFAFERLAGDNRYETAGDVYDAFGESDSVILANGEQGHFPDALVANYLAGVEGSPILLTRSNKMPDATAQRLDGGGKTITIVGGEDVVPADQAAALEAEGHTVERVAGPNRYLTAAEVIEEAGDSPSNTAIITTGVNFPDALAAGPVSVHEGSPIAISRANDIRDEEVDALVASGVSEFIVLGGPTIVGDAVVAELEAAGLDLRDRVFGADRAETSAALANYAIENFGLTDEGVNVASGYIAGTGADALAGGPLTGQQTRPMLITKSNTNPGDGVTDYLTEHACTLTDGIIFGGLGAVDAASESEMEAAAQNCGTNQDFQVGDGTAATNTVSAADDDSGARQYSVSGLDNAADYDLFLFPSENVTTDSNGLVTFKDSDGTAAAGDNVADWTATAADIESVNGTDRGDSNGTVVDISPVNGVINFTVDSTTPDSIVPVLVAADAGSSDGTPDIDLDANNQPTEPFGVGGQKTWLPTEGEDNQALGADEEVVTADEAADRIITEAGLYNYDTNDTFYVYDADTTLTGAPAPSNQVTYEQFEEALSAGDELDAATFYRRTEQFSSTFILENLSPAAPDLSAGATDRTMNSVTLTLAEGEVSEDATEVTIYGQVQGAGADVDVTTDDNVFATATADADADTAGFQVVVNGLAAGTTYDFGATQTVDGDESGVGAEAEDIATRSTPVDRPTITNAEVVADAVTEGLADESDEWFIEFSEAVTAAGGDATVNLTDVDGDTIRVVCVGDGAGDYSGNADDGITEAGCVFGEYNAAGTFVPKADDPTTTTVDERTFGDSVRVVLLEDAEDRNAAGDGATGGIEYPLTVTSVVNVEDVDGDEATVDVAGSSDVSVDDEA